MEGHPDGKDKVLVPADLTESFEPVVGRAVTLRPLRPEDADIELAFLGGLSPQSRYNRLLGGAIRLTHEYIEKLTTVDFSRDMALAATVMLDEREVLIGVARYVRAPDGVSCEFALVVADEWQGHGIGRRMMEKLIAVARQSGIVRMYGEVLATNRPMLEFVQKLGFSLASGPDGPSVTVVTLALA